MLRFFSSFQCLQNSSRQLAKSLRFACCRSLLESLSCSFGKEPPEEVPEGCSKQQFVHELCAQAGAGGISKVCSSVFGGLHSNSAVGKQ